MRTMRSITAIALVSLTLSMALPSAVRAQAAVDYVALGDSYSSGSGTGSYTDEACRRSDLAYPALLAADRGADLTFAACSGATTKDLLAEQADELDAGTDLVTVTIGGNDIGWSDAVTACMIPFYRCTGDVDRAVRFAEDELPALLEAVYAEIAARSPAADVYVLGYPRLFSAEDNCDAFGLISVSEQRLMNEGADVLSETIEAAALAHGFTYVDVRDEFEGHGICDDDAWLHGLTIPIGDSYHPKRSGHSEGYLPALTAAL